MNAYFCLFQSYFTHINNPIDKMIQVLRGCYANEKFAEAMCRTAEGEALLRNITNPVAECSTCDSENGCNGASQWGPITLLIVLPVAIAKIFLF